MQSERREAAEVEVGRVELEDSMSSWPAHLKYYPEENVEAHEMKKRETTARRIREGGKPVAVKAMRPDGSEMFWPSYWGFDANAD